MCTPTVIRQRRTHGRRSGSVSPPNRASSQSVNDKPPSILQQGSDLHAAALRQQPHGLGVSEEAFRTQPTQMRSGRHRTGLPEIASLIKPVFYQDNHHTLFVRARAVTERTIEEWQEWVTPPPTQPEPAGTIRTGGKRSSCPEIPQEEARSRSRRPADRTSIDPGSLINPSPEHDWLVNPATGAARLMRWLIGPSWSAGIASACRRSGRGAADGDGGERQSRQRSGHAGGAVVHDDVTMLANRAGLAQVGRRPERRGRCRFQLGAWHSTSLNPTAIGSRCRNACAGRIGR